MISRFLPLLLIFVSLPFLFSCARGEKKDTSELYEKSQTRGAIIERSGTTFRDEKMQWDDAQNRIQTGGGLLGKKPSTVGFELGKNKPEQSYASVGLPINPYLWRGSLETISFMPLASVDPFAGIIITDWYTTEEDQNQRCKLNIFIKGIDLKTDNLEVNSYCQLLNANGNWINQKVNEENNTNLENAILNKAKKILLFQS